MNLDLKDTKVVVAGGSRGLGFWIARMFVEEGARVWISGRSKGDLKKASAALGGAPFTECDLESEKGRDCFLSEVKNEWSALDTLVLNIGSGKASHPGVDTPDEEWRRVFGLNLFAHTALTRQFKPLLAKSKNASIVGISSIAGQTRLAAPVSYGAAKAALNAYCVSAAAELAQNKIRYNVVAPGNVYVPGGRWDELKAKDPKGVDQYIQTAVPMKRFATPEEIAAFVVFLASARASFCTGSIVRVDGGQAPCT